MTPARHPRPSRELAELRARLADAEETLRAIRRGEVDAVMVEGKQGPQVFTLRGAEHAYRVLIESMHEGALTLTTDMVVLYANQCFARMVKCPLEQMMGGSFRRFLSAANQATLRPLLKRSDPSGSRIQVLLHAADGSQMPAQIAIRPLARNGPNRATIGMVVTDLTEARRTEERLRALTHRVVQVQEAERGRVALELHDNVTQLLCAVLFRIQALVGSHSAGDGLAKKEAMTLRAMLGRTVEALEGITHDLRPSELNHLGLGAALRNLCTKFAQRTGVSVTLACGSLIARLSADTELALYRILQEALKNVEKHARARRVTLRLTQPGTVVQLVIKDDGIGFDPDHQPVRRNGKVGLGLLSMRERAGFVSGTFKLKSVRHVGTEIQVRIPLPPHPTAAH